MSDTLKGYDPDRLLRLSDDVTRIAKALAELSVSSVSRPAIDLRDSGDVSLEQVCAVIRRRQQRKRFFPPDLFLDPAWDMLLELLQAEKMQRRVSVSSVCLASGAPASTALRWLNGMEMQGLIIRRSDPSDGRRTFVELSASARSSIQAWFAEGFAEAA